MYRYSIERRIVALVHEALAEAVPRSPSSLSLGLRATLLIGSSHTGLGSGICELGVALSWVLS
jgi:hypothetical protein